MESEDGIICLDSTQLREHLALLANHQSAQTAQPRSATAYPASVFPHGNSALMPVSARLRDITGTRLGMRRYLNMSRLYIEIHHGTLTQPSAT